MQKGFVQFAILGIIVLVIIGAGAFYLGKLTGKPQTITQIKPSLVASTTLEMERITWDVPAGSIPQTEEQNLRQTVTALAPQSFGKHPEWVYISITKVTISGDWALLNAEDKSKNPSLPVSGVYEFLAQKTQSSWQVITPNDPDFCDALNRAPSSLVGSDPTSYYLGCRK